MELQATGGCILDWDNPETDANERDGHPGHKVGAYCIVGTISSR